SVVGRPQHGAGGGDVGGGLAGREQRLGRGGRGGGGRPDHRERGHPEEAVDGCPQLGDGLGPVGQRGGELGAHPVGGCGRGEGGGRGGDLAAVGDEDV